MEVFAGLGLSCCGKKNTFGGVQGYDREISLLCQWHKLEWLGLMIFRLVLIPYALVLARVLEKFMETFRRSSTLWSVQRDTASETAKRTETLSGSSGRASSSTVEHGGAGSAQGGGVEIALLSRLPASWAWRSVSARKNLVRMSFRFFLIWRTRSGVGDVVVVNGTSGLVEEINFGRYSRDQSGVVHISPTAP
jgi:hypothetical protein